MHAYCDQPDIVLIGNKSDLEHLRVVSEVRARSLAEKYNLPYIETSAATGQNVQRSIDILLELVMMRMETAIDRTKLPGHRGRTKSFVDKNNADIRKIKIEHCKDARKCAC